ncbi:MAG: alpha-(1-_3)-arabinofuranosyltransferase domain-containing protein, partial [Microthrixaceae bacterium]
MTDRWRRPAPLLAFAALCYLPLLATSPGKVLADTKSYLYLDPDRLLARAWSMWDPHVGLGTVTHQNIGFLWPMGPYYWAMEHLGAPDWVAQRLWLGSIVFLAGLGTRYLLRSFGWRGAGVAVGMCAYALTPYLLTISVRISAILLPFVALPWLLALTLRAIRAGGWRHPALFALVVGTAGTSNATSILLVGVGPALWVLWAAAVRDEPLGRIVAAVGRIATLTLVTNAWWIAGLSVQATNGLDVLRYTESVEVTAAASSAQEVLRGLGYWFFYGDDALGPWVGPSRPFQASPWLLVATFAVPVLALASGALARWRTRSFAVLLALVGLALAVGVYPYDDPPPFGRGLRAFLQSDVGMAMRSMPRAAPLVVLALSIMLAAGVHAVSRRVPKASHAIAGAVIALVVLSLPPVWQRTLVPDNLRRPESIPSYWSDAAAHLDATDDGTRVLEVPGADFAAYRWGTTVDPVTPGLTDRPIAARELVPMGSAAAANLLKAYDGRFQATLGEAPAVASIARLLRAGQILVRSDLRYEQYDSPRPGPFSTFVLGAPGLGPPTEFGRPVPNVASGPAAVIDEADLTSTPTGRDPFPVTVLPVTGSLPIVTTKSAGAPVIVAGDGDGIVDAAAAGLIDGTELLRYSASLSTTELRDALDERAVLIVTDTNRRRAERWGSIRFTNGYTEPAGSEPLRIDRSDARLPVFPNATDDARTIAIHRGGITANATSYGGRNEYLPEHRPAMAIDGDPSTAWRAGQDDPIVGERLELRAANPVTTSELTFLAPEDRVNRWITRVALRFDSGPALLVDLDERSRTGDGQTVDIGPRTFSRLSIEAVGDSAGQRARHGGLTSTGFAEVSLADMRLDEAVRVPRDLLRRGGASSQDHALAVVLTRLRSAPTDAERLDEEPHLVRLIDLPTERSFTLGGTARLAPRASDALIEQTLDDVPLPLVTSSSRLPSATARASAATDGDLSTAWTAAFGDQANQWVDVQLDAPRTLDSVELHIVADGRHSVPTRVSLEADGRRLTTVDLPAIADRPTPGEPTPVLVSLPEAITTTNLRVVIDAVRAVETTEWRTRKPRTLPVAVAELGLGAVAPAPRGDLAPRCRRDLLTLDGAPLPVRVSGRVTDALEGAPLQIETCDGASLALGAGEHELRSTLGATTGIDVDRIVLRSASGGTASPITARPLRAEATSPAPAPPAATIVRARPDALDIRVEGAHSTDPFWLTFGQSWNTGWHATVDGRDLGPPALVDGFANGWLIRPADTTGEISLRFTPQRRVDIALWLSLLGALACAGLAARRPPRSAALQGELPEVLSGATVAGPPHPPLSLRSSGAAGVALGALGVILVHPAVGVLTGLLAVVVARGVLPRWL